MKNAFFAMFMFVVSHFCRDNFHSELLFMTSSDDDDDYDKDDDDKEQHIEDRCVVDIRFETSLFFISSSELFHNRIEKAKKCER